MKWKKTELHFNSYEKCAGNRKVKTSLASGLKVNLLYKTIAYVITIIKMKENKAISLKQRNFPLNITPEENNFRLLRDNGREPDLAAFSNYITGEHSAASQRA